MKNSNKKIAQSKEIDADEQRRLDQAKLKKFEATRERTEELKELSVRQGRQRDQAEEASKRLGKKKSIFNNYYVVFGILGAVCLYVVVSLFLNQKAPLHKTPVIDDKKIEEHNSNFPWQQGPNKFYEGSSLADAKKLINTSFASHSNLVRCSVDDSVTAPQSFDSRTQWPNCTLRVANQQKTCGSSFAFAASQTFSERLCISNKSQKLINFSAQELISCDVANQGCNGGYINNSLDYMKTKGLVDEECFAYQADSETVKCDKICANGHREKIDGYCILFGEEDIKKEIFKNGPVIAASQIHVDFLTYKSGIYTKGDEVPRFTGFNAIKIIGWGVESGSESEPNTGNKYWIIQNSWGEDWGENGYAKISIGQELMFDQYAYSIKVRSDIVVEDKRESNKSNSNKEFKTSDINLDDLNLDESS